MSEINNESKWVKSQEDAKVFFDAISNPPTPNKYLKSASQELLEAKQKELKKRMQKEYVYSKKIKFFEVPLLPTLRTLDVFLIKEPLQPGNAYSEEARRQLCGILEKRYGNGFEYWYEQQGSVNEVFRIDAAKNSLLSGESRIVTILNCDTEIIVHEAFHVLMFLSKECGVEVNYESQEWGACMLEYIFKAIQEGAK